MWLIWNVGYPRWLFSCCAELIEVGWRLELHSWPKTQHIKNSHVLFLEFCSPFSSLCCSHASSHIPEDGVNVMVMTCFLVSMRIRRCQSFLPWGFALAQPRSEEASRGWMNLDAQEQTDLLFLLSFFLAAVFATLTFLSAVLLLDTLNVNQCRQPHGSTLLFLCEILV